MKKFIALLLALLMVLALCACGTASTVEPAAEDSAPAEEAAPAEKVEEVVEEAPEEEPAEEVEPLTVIFNCSYGETETGGVLAQYFADKCAEYSGGAINVRISFGETLFTASDQLAAVSDGSINMCELAHGQHAASLPLLCSFPDYAPESQQNAVDYFNYMLRDNEETAAILQAETDSLGIKFLNVTAGGGNCFVANFDFESLTDMIDKSTSFANVLGDKFVTLGFKNVVMVFPWDYYSSFETGLMDSTQMASTPMISMGIPEVAKCWMYDGTYSAGNFFTVNLDWWNGLSDAQRDAIQKAADDVADYSVSYYVDAIAQEVAQLEESGCTVVEMTEEDFAKWWDAVLTSNEKEALANGEQNGNLEAVQTLLAAVAEFTA